MIMATLFGLIVVKAHAFAMPIDTGVSVTTER